MRPRPNCLCLLSKVPLDDCRTLHRKIRDKAFLLCFRFLENGGTSGRRGTALRSGETILLGTFSVVPRHAEQVNEDSPQVRPDCVCVTDGCLPPCTEPQAPVPGNSFHIRRTKLARTSLFSSGDFQLAAPEASFAPGLKRWPAKNRLLALRAPFQLRLRCQP